MIVIAVGSVKGTVGVTVTALALAAAASEHSRVVLVEADPSGGVLTGVCPQLHPSPGLEALAADREPFTLARLAAATQQLGSVPVMVAPVDMFRAWVTVASPRNRWWTSLTADDGLVIIDVGRIGGGSPVGPILGIADRVILVVPPTPLGLAGGLEWCEQGGRIAPGVVGISPEVCRLVTAHPPTRRRDTATFDAGEVRAQAGSRLAGVMPWDPSAVDLLFRGADFSYRNMAGSPLVQAARQLHESLSVSQ
jgi:MinD-like ATPase involved in chromosome partitioning or flagellar assembly